MNNLNQNHITPEQINDYHRGKLTNAEQHALEKAALENPLLAEALEGFEGYDAVRLSGKLSKRWRGGFSWGRMWLFMPVAVGLVFFWLWPTNPSGPAVHQPVNRNPVTHIEPKTDFSGPEMPEVRQTDSSVQIAMSGSERQLAEKYVAIIEREPLPEPIGMKKPEPLKVGQPEKRPGNTSGVGERIYHIADYRVVDYSGRTNPLKVEVFLGGTAADQENADQQTVGEKHEFETAYNLLLQEAISAFASGKNERCAAIMREVLKTFPDDLNALFYGGMAELRLGKNTAAAHRLKAAQMHTKSVFREEAEFYCAMALLADGNTEGTEMMKAIIDGGGFYAGRAKGALEKN